MSAPGKSRWADEDPETEALVAQQKREKEAKKRAKAERQRKLEEEAEAKKAAEAQRKRDDALNEQQQQEQQQPPAKRRRLSIDQPFGATTATPAEAEQQQKRLDLLRFPMREWGPCRHVDNFERLNHIEEGSYGWVSRAKDITSGEVVALKKLKMENSPDGFPVTGLREIQTLLEARHQNVVYLREVVIGSKVDE